MNSNNILNEIKTTGIGFVFIAVALVMLFLPEEQIAHEAYWIAGFLIVAILLMYAKDKSVDFILESLGKLRDKFIGRSQTKD